MNRLQFHKLSTLIAYAYRYKIQRTFTGADRRTATGGFLVEKYLTPLRHIGDSSAEGGCPGVWLAQGAAMTDWHPGHQLQLFGIEEAQRHAEAAGATPSERKKLKERLDMAQGILSALPS